MSLDSVEHSVAIRHPHRHGSHPLLSVIYALLQPPVAAVAAAGNRRPSSSTFRWVGDAIFPLHPLPLQCSDLTVAHSGVYGECDQRQRLRQQSEEPLLLIYPSLGLPQRTSSIRGDVSNRERPLLWRHTGSGLAALQPMCG